jgi:hypothetical protein
VSDQAVGPIDEHQTDPTRVMQNGSSICRLCGGHFGAVWYLCDGCATDPRRTFDRKIVIVRALHAAEIACAQPHRYRRMPDGRYEAYEWSCSICQAVGDVKHTLPHSPECPFSVPTYEEIDAADKFSSDCGQDDRLTFEEEVARQSLEHERGQPLGIAEFRTITVLRATIRKPRGMGVKRSKKAARTARTRSTS